MTQAEVTQAEATNEALQQARLLVDSAADILCIVCKYIQAPLRHFCVLKPFLPESSISVWPAQYSAFAFVSHDPLMAQPTVCMRQLPLMMADICTAPPALIRPQKPGTPCD